MNKTDAINCIQDIIDVANSHGSACVYSRNGVTAQLENVLECLKNSEPVVHCEDCEWFDDQTRMNDLFAGEHYMCRATGCWRKREGFCSSARKKEVTNA